MAGGCAEVWNDPAVVVERTSCPRAIEAVDTMGERQEIR
jgi:hypothetical protein